MSESSQNNRLSLRIDAFVDLVLTMDPEGRLTQVSDSCRRILGQEAAELEGRKLAELIEKPFLPDFHAFLKTLAAGENPSPLDLELRGAEGLATPVEISALAIREKGETIGSQAVIRETRHSRQLSDRLLEQKRRLAVLREIADSLHPVGSVDVLLQSVLKRLLSLGRFSAGATFRRWDGKELSRVALIGPSDLFPADISLNGAADSPLPDSFLSYPRLLSSDNPVGRPLILDRLAEQGMPGSLILPLASHGRLRGLSILASGNEFHLDGDLRAMLRWLGNLLGQTLENQDLREENRELQIRFKDLTESSTDHIWEVDRNGRYIYNSPNLTLTLGYKPEDVHGRCPVDFIHPEEQEEARRYLVKLQKEKKALRGMINRVFNAEGKIVYIESRAIPVFDTHGRVCGYRGVDRNITDWFESKRALEDTLVGTCEALGKMVELRDPYTKGHSVRVSQLMVLIGKAMGRSSYDLQGLRLTGLLHDIGKIGIPTEILVKPGRLSSEEMDLMRQHPTMGYDILKDISFPWPVAAVVYQHHERLDGSGYPQGLTGDDITWQVRLLAVADLLEAMATDRPYRQSLGRESALEELESNRGLLYDSEIVDTILKLEKEGILAEFFEQKQPQETPIRASEPLPDAPPADGRAAPAAEDQDKKREDNPDYVLLTLLPEKSTRHPK